MLDDIAFDSSEATLITIKYLTGGLTSTYDY